MKKQFKFNKVKPKLDPELVSEIEALVGEDADVCRKDCLSDIDIETKRLEEGSRTAIRYVSTRAVDQAGDVIMPKGVDTKLFEKAGMPVFWGHNYSIPQIGRDTKIVKDEYGVKVWQKYADLGEGSLAETLWRLTQQDMNKGSSVGIIPTEVLMRGDRDFEKTLKTLRKEWPEFDAKSMKACRRIIVKSILFEHSDVSIPCNTDTGVISVSKMFKENGADEVLLKQLGLEMEENGDETPKTDVDKLSDTNSGNDDLLNKDSELSDETSDEPIVDTEKDVVVEEVEIKEKSKVTLVKEPRVVKLVQGPQIDLEKAKEEAKAEIRKRMGRLL